MEEPLGTSTPVSPKFPARTFGPQIDEDTDAVSLLFRDLADAMKALEAFVDRVVGETESGHVHAGPDHGPQVASSSLAGPMVATIFVRRFMSARLVT